MNMFVLDSSVFQNKLDGRFVCDSYK